MRTEPRQHATWNRRRFLGAAGFGVGVSVGAATLSSCDLAGRPANNAGSVGALTEDSLPAPLAGEIVPFDDVYQAGVATDSQAQLCLVGFDLKKGTSRDDLVNLMSLWTDDARHLCTGEAPLGSLEPELAAIPANLTITCGWGEGAFRVLGASESKPQWLRPVAKFDRDELSDDWGQTDLVLQICADDAGTATHAMRHMVRAGADYATVAWLQQGFSNAHGAKRPGDTPRNLFGQKDGTVNPRQPEEYDAQVWIGADGLGNEEKRPWLEGSTAMVVRRIRMNVDTWEQLDRASRENAIGRTLGSGAPLSNPEGDEFESVNPKAVDKYGLPMVDPNSHVARALPPRGKPEQMLRRRPYSYNLPPTPADAKEGQLSNVGLIFICFQKDPTRQFEPIQKRLDESDLLNTWITHIGSSVYWVPPGTGGDGGSGTYWGQGLVEAVS
ncbi:Dyp-type peroxidase [Corynebacterium incognita]|uniref:Dyp-type peroxidase n=1 Tax=Corynebacterium incognita TaxID=2754725 RepID=A0A7G7CQ06_9CORY|nr:Dyp-type peroxidase [Corynebacterium incognita]QNE89672.1 Dyp-type peroxidase [Corynebacterium incognita]